ncbi:hypothetical protein [Haloarchaeobius amylolyticus]|uniref:hypothetical protein n=1 Tax=Haloarchaeobius amylolyticus TaxID=1198296 RepID=UPI0022717CDC|nr:hypothetical protein [Haloarchaeobius amylolyticus]
MGLLSSRKVKALLAMLVLTLFALVGVSAWGLLQAVAALGTAGSLFAFVGAVAPWVVGTLLLTLLSVVWVVWLLVVAVSQVSMPSLHSQRLSQAASLVEYAVPEARKYGVSEWLAPPEPTLAEKREALTERYVDGDLSDSEFERELQRLYEDEEGFDNREFRNDLDALLDDAEHDREYRNLERESQ